MNPLKAAIVLAKQGTPEALAILDLIADLCDQRDSLLEQHQHAKDALDKKAYDHDTLLLLMRATDGMLNQSESQCNEQHSLLKQAKALLQDWVLYNDNKKNADLAAFSKNLIKELP